LTATFRLNTTSEPFKDATYNSNLTAIYDDRNEDPERLTRKSLQGFSTFQWRPEEKPFVVTGSLRTLTEELERTDDDAPEGTSTQLAAANVGLRWPVNDRLSVGFGLRALVESVDRGEGGAIGESGSEDGARISGGFLANAGYNSQKREVANFDWSWTARAQTDNGYDTQSQFFTSETLSLGHRFDRYFDDLFFLPVTFSFSQDAGMGFDSAGQDPVSASLSDSVALSYAKSTPRSSTTARLALRDSRSLIGEKSELQSLLARIGRRLSVDTDRSLAGDVSAQLVRQVADDGADFSMSASGLVTYGHRDLFAVENLSFRSELRISLVNFEQVFGESPDEEYEELLRNDWRNILTYQIGRLTTSLEASAFQRESGIGYLGIFRISRAFGDG